jgi:hypothetical protein
MLLAFAVGLTAMVPKAIFTFQHGACYPPGSGDYRIASTPGVRFYRTAREMLVTIDRGDR